MCTNHVTSPHSPTNSSGTRMSRVTQASMLADGLLCSFRRLPFLLAHDVKRGRCSPVRDWLEIIVTTSFHEHADFSPHVAIHDGHEQVRNIVDAKVGANASILQ